MSLSFKSIRPNATVRVTFGLLMLTLSILFVSDWLGLVPDERELLTEQRKRFSETLAVQFTSLAQTGDMRHVRTTLAALVARDTSIDSAAFRTTDNELSLIHI